MIIKKIFTKPNKMKDIFDFNHIDPSVDKKNKGRTEKTLQILPQTLVVSQKSC